MRYAVLPARGEFGLRLRYHVPVVHALSGPKVVAIEEGDHCLYPSADEFLVLPRVHDNQRRGTYPANDRSYVHAVRKELQQAYPGAEIVQPQKGMNEARFIPEPTVRKGIKCDIVICPRKRMYGGDKNWDRWGALAGLPGVFAAGAPDSSYDIGIPNAWSYERFLDASVEAMLSAKLVIATDAGLAHLAVLCGRPLLLVTYRGRVAPGAVRDPQGKAMEPEYWPVRWKEYYESANHTGAPIETVDGWEHPERVVERVEEILSKEAAA